MPIYEYECGTCGDHHEVLQKISDPLLKVCPSCGANSLKKLVSAASFRLSGSGWYETDFKSDNKRNLAKSDSKEIKKEDKKASDKKSTSAKKDTKTESSKVKKSSKSGKSAN